LLRFWEFNVPPFRQPASSESDDSWQAPDYFKPESSDAKWTAPDYFTPEKEAPKPSEFKARASKALGEFVSDVKSIPAAVSKFADEHPKIKEAGRRLLEGSKDEDLYSKEDLAKGARTLGPEFQKIPGVGKATDWLQHKIDPTESPWYSGVRPFAAGLTKLVGGAVESAADPRAMFKAEIHAPSEEPPIRQSREIPYRMPEETIKPKPADIPLKADVPAPVAEVPVKADEIPVKQTVKKVKKAVKGTPIAPEAELPAELQAYDKKQGMAQPLSDEELTKTKDPIQKTFNPFNKVKTAEASPEFETKPVEESQVRQPQARFAHYDPLLEANQYNIEGGEFDRSTKGQKFIDDNNIPISEGPTNKPKIPQNKLDELRAKASDWKRPDYFTPEETTTRTSEEELTKGFGGSGHPESPDYVSKVLSDAGKGDAGLKIEDKEGFKHVVYRNQKGEPIAAAKIVTGPDGKNMIQDIAADKSKGLLTGRAMKAIGDKLNELGATESSGTTSSDAQNFLAKMKDRMSKAADIKAPEPVGIGARIKGFLKDEEGSARLPDEGEENKLLYEVPERLGDDPRPMSLAESLKRQANVLHEQIQEALAKYPEEINRKYMIEMKKQLDDLSEHIKKVEPKNDITEMHGGLGLTGNSTPKQPSTGPHAAVLDKLFNSLEESKGLTDVQSQMYKKEQAKRFSAYSDQSISGGGVSGAAKRLSTLKGQYEKIEPLYGKLQLDEKETASLFDAVDKANISTPEKARGTVALFKLMNGESVPQRNELALLDEVFGNGFANRITEMHGGIGATGIKIAKAANTMKSMENAMSLAAPLRHGAGLMYRKEFTPAFADMFKFFGNKEYYNAAMDALEKRPNYLLGRESGLFFAKQGSMLNSEEQFLNSYVGDIPKLTGIPQTVAASQRGYVGFLNKLRSDVFDGMVKTMKGLGHETHTTVGDQMVPSKGVEAIARFINNATGRGELPGNMNKLTNELNALLWSPRMISSRINMLANPKIYMDLPKGMRLEGLKSLLGIASMSLVINGLGILGGATVGTNILSTDFMKSRFKGGKIVDPNAGMQQYIVGAARFLAGKTDSNTPTSRLDIAGRFLANKESPAASLAHTLLTAKKFTGKSDDPATAGNFTTQYGEKTNIQSEIGKRFTPIFIQDLEDLMKNEPDWSENVGLNTVMGAASLAGMSQNYKEKKSSRLGLGSMKLGR
jgi:hypothetical protein